MGNNIIISARKSIAYILSQELALKDVSIRPQNNVKWYFQEFILACTIYGLFFVVSTILDRILALGGIENVLQLAYVFSIMRVGIEILRVIDLTDANNNNESFVLTLSTLVSYGLVAWFDYFFPAMVLLLLYFLIKTYIKYLDLYENYIINYVMKTM
jgi:hypothetical protein